MLQLKEFHTVTSFLTHNGKILILKRSDKVGAYQGLWAGISGYVEEGVEPKEQAMIEIEEEVGIDRSHLKLLKEGKLIRAVDEKIGKTWLIHPFLFEVDTNEVKIDWEHTDYRWINKEEIPNYDTVPEMGDLTKELLK